MGAKQEDVGEDGGNRGRWEGGSGEETCCNFATPNPFVFLIQQYVYIN